MLSAAAKRSLATGRLTAVRTAAITMNNGKLQVCSVAIHEYYERSSGNT